MGIIMGSDNLYHKRKGGKSRFQQRSEGNRKQYDLVLIVCEGSKTEPNYFKGLKDELRLTNIKIMPSRLGNDPLSIVNFAIEELQKEDYDYVYCVFDKEDPNYQDSFNYQSALQKVKAHASNGKPIYYITSVPCFEYWILLHYEKTSSPYAYKGRKTVGEQLFSAVKKYIQDYSKGDKNIFRKTKDSLDIAISRAKSIDLHQKKNGTDNPSTKVYLLVEALRKMQK
jgi:hypothetical protein